MMTEGVHYIRDKASPPGHESEHANTRFLEHLHVIAFCQSNMYKQIQAKTIETFIQACVQG
jgi:ferredoxin-like protein FixX